VEGQRAPGKPWKLETDWYFLEKFLPKAFPGAESIAGNLEYIQEEVPGPF